jgi:hypothetical protein
MFLYNITIFKMILLYCKEKGDTVLPMPPHRKVKGIVRSINNKALHRSYFNIGCRGNQLHFFLRKEVIKNAISQIIAFVEKRFALFPMRSRCRNKNLHPIFLPHRRFVPESLLTFTDFYRRLRRSESLCPFLSVAVCTQYSI